MLLDVFDELAGFVDADTADTAVLLASELCENVVLHAGTAFEVALTVVDDDVTVAVTDRGSGPLELHLAQPRRRYGRAASHGRGLELVHRLATSWGTRHEPGGRHVTWFSLSRRDCPPRAGDPEPVPDTARAWSAAEHVHRLLHVPPTLADRLDPLELVAELARRLREQLDAESVSVEVDEGDGSGHHEVARDGVPRPASDPRAKVIEAALPLTPPLRGTLRVSGAELSGSGDPSPDPERSRYLIELVAHRAAMAVESRWLRAVDRQRRAFMTYLADVSELLGQSLDVDLAAAVVPQVVVPRLGRWCAVHLLDPAGVLQLTALSHTDENELPELRAVLEPRGDPGLPHELRARLTDLLRDGSAPVQIAVPTDGLALALQARGATIGTLIVGRPDGRPHSPEDVVLAGDIARRAALAIGNAQSASSHIAVSQALQQALLPRALPLAPGIEFAGEYLPASAGTDVCGDFYDVLTVDPTRWFVSIGDVCGKGARAAARTGLVRDVLRVLVREGRSMIEALTALNDVMMDAGDPSQFATVAAAMVRGPAPGDPPGLGVELVLAGHLQPVVVRADGTSELVGRFGTAVGLIPAVRLHRTWHRLAPGETLLLYTDGVTEHRRGTEQFGSVRLLAASAGAARTASALVAAVREAVERFSTHPLGDDVALLAVRAAP